MTMLIRGTVFDDSIWTLALLGIPLFTAPVELTTFELLLETTPAGCCFCKDVGGRVALPAAFVGAIDF